jgi:hypothetical protein
VKRPHRLMKSKIFSSKMHSISSKSKEATVSEQDAILRPPHVNSGGGRKFPKWFSVLRT